MARATVLSNEKIGQLNESIYLLESLATGLKMIRDNGLSQTAVSETINVTPQEFGQMLKTNFKKYCNDILEANTLSVDDLKKCYQESETFCEKVIKIAFRLDETKSYDFPEFDDAKIHNAIGKILTPRDQQVLYSRLNDHKTYEEIAKDLCRTADRVRQISNRVVRKLQNPSFIRLFCPIIFNDDEELSAIYDQIISIYKKTAEMNQYKDFKDMFSIPKKDLKVPKLEDLDLSVRSYNSLRRVGLYDLNDWAKMDPTAWVRIRNIGVNSLTEIKKKMEPYGIDIALPDDPRFQKGE